MDEIRIENLDCYGYHGVYSKEKKEGQHFYINAVLYTDTREAGRGDDLRLATDYGAVCHFIHQKMTEHTYDLIETVANKLAEEILLNYDLIKGIELEVRKPQAPIGLPFESVSVKLKREWHRVYLSVGSNMGDKEQHIQNASKALKNHPLIKNMRESALLITKPYGGVEQEDFLNGAIEMETLLSPEELLGVLHGIEADEQRERTLRWGPRTLDLDIIFYDKLIYESKDLMIPHVDMENRYFVLRPLSELAPNYRHPILQKTVTQLLNNVVQSERTDR